MSAEELRKKIEERRKKFQVNSSDMSNEADNIASRGKKFGKVFNDSIKGANKFSSIEVTNDIKIDEETIHKRKEKFKVNDNETDANLGLNHYADMNKKGFRGRGGRQLRQGRQGQRQAQGQGRLRLSAPGRERRVLRKGLRLGVNKKRNNVGLEGSLTASREGRRPRFNNPTKRFNNNNNNGESQNLKQGGRRFNRNNFNGGNRRSNFRGGRFSNFRRNRY
jgi:hypothetical protein